MAGVNREESQCRKPPISVTSSTNNKYEQYQDASNLNARIALHQRFGTSKIGWHRLVFDQVNLPPDARVLELGCGPGQLWLQNLDRIPTGWSVILSDLSAGMVEQARAHLSKRAFPFAFAQFDAQEIPFDDGSFDAVIANHMLYHIPERQKTYAEVNESSSLEAFSTRRPIAELP